MYTAEALSDLHERTHRSLQGFLEHCSGLSEEELSRAVAGFGEASVRRQLHHAIGAEEYWVGVLRGLMLVEEREADLASVDALRAYRKRVAGTTAAYLASTTDAELNQPRKMTTWGGHERELVPAHVVLRTQTHIFHHQGQVAAMCRALGHPIPPGLDFPLHPPPG